jgi:hypothetical protein
LARKTDRSKVNALETEKAQLVVQVAPMTQELTEKSEEIRRYQAEQTVVLSRIREWWVIWERSSTRPTSTTS